MVISARKFAQSHGLHEGAVRNLIETGQLGDCVRMYIKKQTSAQKAPSKMYCIVNEAEALTKIKALHKIKPMGLEAGETIKSRISEIDGENAASVLNIWYLKEKIKKEVISNELKTENMVDKVLMIAKIKETAIIVNSHFKVFQNSFFERFPELLGKFEIEDFLVENMNNLKARLDKIDTSEL